MSDLGNRQAVGVLSQSNRITPGGWVITFTPQNMPNAETYEVYHGAVTGPGGYFLVYLEDALYGVGENGRINEYAPDIPMYVRKGQFITMHFSIATGTAPKCWLYFRTPEAGIF